jgi:hypothetical protein
MALVVVASSLTVCIQVSQALLTVQYAIGNVLLLQGNGKLLAAPVRGLLI